MEQEKQEKTEQEENTQQTEITQQTESSTQQTENTQPKESAQQKASTRQTETNWSFLGGMFCGALITLACFWIVAGYARLRPTRDRAAIAQTDSEDLLQADETEQTEDVFALNMTVVQKKIGQIANVIDAQYLGDADEKKVEEGIYRGMVEGLDDPYAAYYSRQNLEELDESTKGAYTGIGATMQQDPQTGAISVVSIFDGTPAAEAGIQVGDVLVGVDGAPTDGLDLSEVVALIKTEEGETVVLDFLREGQEVQIPVTRRTIQVPTVEYEMLEGGIGYLRILEFDDVTTKQTKEALKALRKEGMEKLIVDLRDNPGGVLDVVVDVLDLFLPKGLVVYTEDKGGARTEFFAKGNDQFQDPLVVLVNGNTASAAEIFAGAIKDYGAGKLVGETTFGKGIVQQVFNFADGTGVKLTVAKYYTPNGQFIQDKGIAPDVEVLAGENQTDGQEAAQAEDPQLERAIAELS